MIKIETQTQLDLAETSCLRTEIHSNFLDEISATPTELPSPLSVSERSRLPTVSSAFQTEKRLADLEATLLENQEKMSKTLESITNTLTLLSRTLLSRPLVPASLPTTVFQSELKPALLPKYDGNQQNGKAFVNACQAFFRLRPDQFPDEQIKIQWAMTYMSQGRAQRWVNRIYQWEVLPANINVNYFVAWDDFRSFFRKEFFPLHAEAVAKNVLEGNTYFQGCRNVDDYLDEFRDLVSESGYTSPKTIVVKFRQALNVEIGDAIATMAVGRPDDLDPEAWFKAAVRIDQSQATNLAFRVAIVPTPLIFTLPPAPERLPVLPLIVKKQQAPPKTAQDLLLVSDVSPQTGNQPEVTEIKGMSADAIRKLIQHLYPAQKVPAPPEPKTSANLHRTDTTFWK
jgi:hypothetical protein